MTATSDDPQQADPSAKPSAPRKKRRRRRWLGIGGGGVLFILILLIVGRAMLPWALRSYVNRTLDQNPLYDGKIGDIDVHLWRGAYSIEDIRLVKTTGNVPVPLFSSKRLDLAIEWRALLSGKIVGRVAIEQPELNFVDAGEKGESQTGVGGPWLKILEDLFPFKINSLYVNHGSIHFRAFDTEPPLDMYIADLNASILNLSNIHDDVTPLISTVEAKGMALGHAPFEYKMQFDPFSYRPTFKLAVRLIGLDVTKINTLTRKYGAFDFERGWFDLVVELDAKEGYLEGYTKPLFRNLTVLSLRDDVKEDNVVEVDAKEGNLEGYVKPLFRDLKVLSLRQDIKEGNVIQFFWEALLGVATEILENQPRDQFGTVINFKGDASNPQTSILEIVGNVLRNAFIRAYLPRLHGEATQVEGLQFSPGEVSDPIAPIGN